MSAAAFVQVSKKLQKLLQDALVNDGKPKVVLDDPSVVPSSQDSVRVSLWLYQAAADEFSRNASPPTVDERTKGSLRFRMPPLGVNLFYLVTPLLGNSEADQQALARIMLTMHENALLNVVQEVAEVNEQVRITLLNETLDDRIKLWESLGKPHRLSVAYQIRTVRLISKEMIETAPVLSSTTASQEIQPVRSDA